MLGCAECARRCLPRSGARLRVHGELCLGSVSPARPPRDAPCRSCEGCPRVSRGPVGSLEEGVRRGPAARAPRSKGLEVTSAPQSSQKVVLCFPQIHNLSVFFLALSLMYVKILKALVYYIKNYVSCSAFFYLLKLFKQ